MTPPCIFETSLTSSITANTTTKVFNVIGIGGNTSMIRIFGDNIAAAIMTPNTAPLAPITGTRDPQLHSSHNPAPEMLALIDTYYEEKFYFADTAIYYPKP